MASSEVLLGGECVCTLSSQPPPPDPVGGGWLDNVHEVGLDRDFARRRVCLHGGLARRRVCLHGDLARRRVCLHGRYRPRRSYEHCVRREVLRLCQGVGYWVEFWMRTTTKPKKMEWERMRLQRHGVWHHHPSHIKPGSDRAIAKRNPARNE